MVTASENDIETGYAHATHMLDMDHSSVTGQARVCPGLGSLGWGQYEDPNCQGDVPYFSPTSNHYKCMGIFDWANILAEPVLGDGGLLIAKWAQSYKVDQIRSVGHILDALSAAYAYTDSASWKNYLQLAFIQCDIDSGTNTITREQPFQQAYVGEGIMWALHEIDTLTQARRALRAWADYWAANYDMSSAYPAEHSFGDYPDLTSGFFPGLSEAIDLFPENNTLYKHVLSDIWSNYISPSGQGNLGDGRLKTLTQKFKGTPHYFHLVQKQGYNPLLPDYFAASVAVNAVEKKNVVTFSKSSLSVYPNPSNAGAWIRFDIPLISGNSTPVSLAVYNTSGRLVSQITKDDITAGVHSVEWNGKNFNGTKVPSGVYMITFKAGNQRMYKKLVLTR